MSYAEPGSEADIRKKQSVKDGEIWSNGKESFRYVYAGTEYIAGKLSNAYKREYLEASE